MKRRPKHRYTEQEELQMYQAMTREEQVKYSGLLLGAGCIGFTDSMREALRALERPAMARMAVTHV